MDTAKTGLLIRKRRKELGYTQRKLAELLFVEPKTISKWETGKGSPDISSIPKLSEALGLETTALIKGEIEKKLKDTGNLRRMSFYICPECLNTIWSTSSASVFCCAHKLEALKAESKEIIASAGILDDSYYIELISPMTKTDYVLFVAFEKDDTLILRRLYPEGPGSITIPRMMRGNLYIAESCGKIYKYRLSEKKESIEIKAI